MADQTYEKPLTTRLTPEGFAPVVPPASSGVTAQFNQEMYLDIMREGPPLHRYVSRGDRRDSIDIPAPHEAADRAIMRAIRFTMSDRTPRFQPILAGAGMGKTHLFWVIKDREQTYFADKYLAVYVPSPPAPVRVPLHFHACIVDEAGEAIFEQAVDMLIAKFGGAKGATHDAYDFNYAMDRLIHEFPGISSDVVKVLLRYRLDVQNRALARRWLFGDALSEEEIAKLGARTVLEDDDVTLAVLKLLAEGSERSIVLFVDEMEAPYNTHGEQGERQFLEVLKRMYNEFKNVVIITSCLSEIWDRVCSLADAPMMSRMESPVQLRHFNREDLAQYVAATMNEYWKAQNVDAPPDLLFPFSQNDVDAVFVASRGIAREAIKNLILILDTKLSVVKEEELVPQTDHVVKLTSSVVVGVIVEALTIAGKGIGVSVRLHVMKAGSEKQATVIIVLAKAGRQQRLCIDIPNVKDWDRSAGVAAFYSVKRLNDVLEAGEADVALISIPQETKGAKFEIATAEMGGKLLTLRLSCQSATRLVENINAHKIDTEQLDLLRAYISQMFS